MEQKRLPTSVQHANESAYAVCAVRLRPGLRHHDGRGQPHSLHVAQRELPADVHVAVATGKHLRRLQRKLLREPEVDDGQGRHQQGTKILNKKNAFLHFMAVPLDRSDGRAAVTRKKGAVFSMFSEMESFLAADH